MEEVNLYNFLGPAIPYIDKYGYAKDVTKDTILKNIDDLEWATSDEIEEFKQWVESKNDSDYIRNVKEVLGQKTIKSWQYNILCSAVNSWRKAIKQKKEVYLSNYVGDIGDRISFKVRESRILRSRWFGGYNGNEYNFYRIVGEDNNIYLWGTSSWVEDGDTIEGIVKDHKEYNGEKQTLITKGHIVDGKRFVDESYPDDNFSFDDLLKDLYED